MTDTNWTNEGENWDERIKRRLLEEVQSAQVNNFTLTQQTKKDSSSICPNEKERESERRLEKIDW